MTRGQKNSAKAAAVVILSPLIFSTLLSTIKFFSHIFLKAAITFPFIIGFLAYVPVYFRFPDSGYGYVLSHELAHAAAAVASGIKIKKISVRRNSGHVTLAGNNIFILLAPYFIPFYALAAGILYATLSCFYDVSDYRRICIGIIGFLISHHIMNTANVLFGPVQSDIKKAGGVVFSFLTVVFLNSLFLMAILKFIFPDIISLSVFGKDIALRTQGFIAVFSRFILSKW
ncbi:MAG: hypothetical protein HY746_03910 [Elusimicrobia bacterium]|nr:hypothetical protein [Elusimicrobiota bacterium]